MPFSSQIKLFLEFEWTVFFCMKITVRHMNVKLTRFNILCNVKNPLRVMFNAADINAAALNVYVFRKGSVFF